MFGFVKDDFLYIKCPRNGSTTFAEFLGRHGWQRINLFNNTLDLRNMRIWAHITDPHQRHTKGLEKYLRDNPDININDPVIGKILISGVFDEHTYSLRMMLGNIWDLDIHWIPLDAGIVDYRLPPAQRRSLTGDDLTNDFFAEHGIDLMITADDHVNVYSDPLGQREKINDLKKVYHDNYQKLVKNFLEPDLVLYYKTLDKFRQKYHP